MIGRFVRIVFLVLLCLGFSRVTNESQQVIDRVFSRRVLLLYDDVQPPQDVRRAAQIMLGDWDVFPYPDAAHIYVTMLQNLLGGLSTEVELRAVSSYQKDSAFEYLRTFYVGSSQNQLLPEDFIQDILHGAPVTWLGYNAEALKAIERPLGIEVKGINEHYHQNYQQAYTEIYYKGQIFRKALEPMEMLELTVSPQVQVHAVARNALGQELPYMVQQQNFWLIADLPFTYIHEGDRYLVLADALHTMLGQKLNCSPTAFLRLEDISPQNEVDLLEPIFSLLVEEHVYFNLAVIPFYVDAPKQIRLSWQDNPQSLAAITNIAKHGWAAIWQHGTTHQSDAYLNPDGVSAVDWEFWDSQSFKPLENLDASKAIQRVIMGKQALYDLGFSPVGWVTPHYAAPPDYLQTFNQTYSMFFERRFIQSGQLQTTQFFPYPVEDSLGGVVLPENTGYLDGQQSLHDMLEIARLNRALQCPYLGLFMHPFVFRPDYKGNEATSLEELRTFLRDLRQLGYTFSIPETAESINP